MGIIDKIKTMIANRKNYGGIRQLSAIKYIVIHYTANDGDTDENNGTYFKNNVVKASAHYFVDSDSITQSVSDSFIAYHVGARRYKHKYCRNSNSIGIEICDDNKNGIIYPSSKTIENALQLTTYLMNKYSIPKNNVIRHYDVTGKLCPAYWSGTETKDRLWKTEFWDRLPYYASTQNQTPANMKGDDKVSVKLNILRKGSTGENVKALQILLNGRDFQCGIADGKFGSQTLYAVKKFQAENSLTVDGIVGADTWTMLLK